MKLLKDWLSRNNNRVVELKLNEIYWFISRFEHNIVYKLVYNLLRKLFRDRKISTYVLSLVGFNEIYQIDLNNYESVGIAEHYFVQQLEASEKVIIIHYNHELLFFLVSSTP